MTYAFHFTVRIGNERVVIREALDFYIKHCQDEIDKGHHNEFFEKSQTAQDIKASIYQGIVQTSGNNFFDQQDK